MTSEHREFVGRANEIAILQRAWRHALDDSQARLVAVRGPAGSGKTAMVASFLAKPGGAPMIVDVSADQARPVISPRASAYRSRCWAS